MPRRLMLPEYAAARRAAVAAAPYAVRALSSAAAASSLAAAAATRSPLVSALNARNVAAWASSTAVCAAAAVTAVMPAASWTAAAAAQGTLTAVTTQFGTEQVGSRYESPVRSMTKGDLGTAIICRARVLGWMLVVGEGSPACFGGATLAEKGAAVATVAAVF